MRRAFRSWVEVWAARDAILAAMERTAARLRVGPRVARSWSSVEIGRLGRFVSPPPTTELVGAASAPGSWLMHESFKVDDASSYTRPWFAWANSLFGELILTLAEERPHLLGLPPRAAAA